MRMKNGPAPWPARAGSESRLSRSRPGAGFSNTPHGRRGKHHGNFIPAGEPASTVPFSAGRASTPDRSKWMKTPRQADNRPQCQAQGPLHPMFGRRAPQGHFGGPGAGFQMWPHARRGKRHGDFMPAGMPASTVNGRAYPYRGTLPLAGHFTPIGALYPYRGMIWKPGLLIKSLMWMKTPQQARIATAPGDGLWGLHLEGHVRLAGPPEDSSQASWAPGVAASQSRNPGRRASPPGRHPAIG
jgi:hypothetical protein